MFSDLSEKERSSRTCVPLFCCVGFPLYRNQTLLKGIIILKFIRTSEYASHLLIHFICAYVSSVSSYVSSVDMQSCICMYVL